MGTLAAHPSPHELSLSTYTRFSSPSRGHGWRSRSGARDRALARVQLSHFEGLAWWLGRWRCSSHAGSCTPLTVPFRVENGTVPSEQAPQQVRPCLRKAIEPV